MKCSVLVAVLCFGTVQLADGRAQYQPNPTTTYPGQVNYPGFPGGQGGFPGGLPGGQGGLGGLFGGASAQSPQSRQAVEELKRNCLANGGPKAFEQLEFAGGNIQKCVAGVMPALQMSAQGGKLGDVCKTVHDTIRKCLAEFTSKLEKCLDKSMAYAPGFQMEMFDSVFKFVCKDDGKHIMTLIMSMAQPSECMQNLQAASQGCLSKTKKFKMEDLSSGKFDNITKPELCSDTKILRDCVNENARKQCTGDMLDFVTGISNAMYEPCSACTLFITNSFLLFVLVLLTKLF